MQEYIYTLNDSDYIEYLEDTATRDRTVVFRSLLFTYGSLPVLGLALWLMGVRKVLIYAALLLLFFLWVPLSKQMIGKLIRSSIEKKLKESGERKYSEMKVSVHDGRAVVKTGNDTSEQRILGCRMFGHLLVLTMENGADLLIPSRVFKEDAEAGLLMKEIKGENKE